ncbi:hypothetical protein PWM41_000217 [Providencia rettgeri]|uniref:hypothetical protein n=1 Tax=Providencia TaxID=586 RepID=UPI002349DB3C|nr:MULTISPECIES: hypothetical protein [Providencia]EMB5784702.1 hypothetical protein [Providencia rettgeri]MDK7743473.1 hypothetical protein [Providencia rettgeri]MDK7756315.1 hypothetical protein [Providencia rettgeri]
MNKRISYFLCVTALAMSVLTPVSYGDNLRVSVGATGYLGEVSPPVRVVNFEERARTRRINPNFPFIELITWKKGGSPNWEYTYYPPEGAYGVTLVNEFDKNNRIILLINGTFSTRYLRYKVINDVNSGHVWESASFTLKNSKMTSSDRMYHVPIGSSLPNPLNFGLEPQSGANGYIVDSIYAEPMKFTGIITSYSAYAPQPLKKGRYFADDRLIMAHRDGPGDGFSVNQSNATFINEYQDLGVFAVDACKVAPITNTQINFGSQLAGTYPSPKNLANALAQLNVSCPNTGKYFMSVKPNNALVSGSQTGMVLDSLDGHSGDLPYIATSVGATTKGNEVCTTDSSQAINYTESKQIYSTAGKNFIQGLNFALCVNGKIDPGKYRGSLDVNFLIE